MELHLVQVEALVSTAGEAAPSLPTPTLPNSRVSTSPAVASRPANRHGLGLRGPLHPVQARIGAPCAGMPAGRFCSPQTVQIRTVPPAMTTRHQSEDVAREMPGGRELPATTARPNRSPAEILSFLSSSAPMPREMPRARMGPDGGGALTWEDIMAAPCTVSAARASPAAGRAGLALLPTGGASLARPVQGLGSRGTYMHLLTCHTYSPLMFRSRRRSTQ